MTMQTPTTPQDENSDAGENASSPPAPETPIEPQVLVNEVNGDEAAPVDDHDSEAADDNEKLEPFDRSRIRTANEQVRVNSKDRYTEPHGKIHRVPLNLAIVLPSVPVTEMNALSDSYGPGTISESEATKIWLESLALGGALLHRGDALYKTQFIEDSEWVNRPEIDGERYGIGIPRYGDEGQGGLLTGARAVQHMQSIFGIGSTYRVPLWHSGIWVSFKAPQDAELLELNSQMDSEKVTIGRVTHGMLFSNTSVVTNRLLIDFALAHIYQASVEYNKIEDLKDIILLSDLPTLIWGLMCTIYPNGFPYERPCVTGPEKCTYVARENLQLTKLTWTNHRSLTVKQRQHMKKRKANFTQSEIKTYQSEHHFKVERTLDVGFGVKIEFRTPTLADYEISGKAWVENLVESVDEAFGGRVSADERNTLIIQRAQTQAVRQYAHYIERIITQSEDSDQDRVIEDRTSLEDTLAAISAAGDVYENIVNGVGAYIEGTAMSLIAIPRYNCPVCDHDQGLIPAPEGSGEEPRKIDTRLHPVLIPLDVGQLFFTLTGRRLSQALSKRLA